MHKLIKISIICFILAILIAIYLGDISVLSPILPVFYALVPAAIGVFAVKQTKAKSEDKGFGFKLFSALGIYALITYLFKKDPKKRK